MSEILLELHKLQQSIVAPKNQRAQHFNYRSCEDILEAAKPLMPEGAVILLTDKIEVLGDRFYVVATAAFCLGDQKIETSSTARESFERKGLDSAQVTGSASSYARKYALNGLLMLSDTKDPDYDHSSHPPASEDESNMQPVKNQRPPDKPNHGLDAETWTWPFGRDKGKRLTEFNMEELNEKYQFLKKRYDEKLAKDPQNRYLPDDRAILDMIDEYISGLEQASLQSRVPADSGMQDPDYTDEEIDESEPPF